MGGTGSLDRAPVVVVEQLHLALALVEDGAEAFAPGREVALQGARPNAHELGRIQYGSASGNVGGEGLHLGGSR
jgi:hypothetical protein